MLWLFTLALAGAVTGGPAPDVPAPIVVLTPAVQAARLLAAETRRIRPATPRVSQILSDGIRRSPTFAKLVTDIHDTNVIVYVEATFNLPPDMAGRILLTGVAGEHRYLRVQVHATLQGDQMISVIAHELRHALEVAAERTVVDDKGLAALYKRIGDVPHVGGGYDTEAARRAGRTVRNELIG